MSERVHPYDLVFGTPEIEGEAFALIKEEVEARGVDIRERERFIMLAQVGELMRSLLPAEATAPAVSQFAAIVTHAYHYWVAGKQTFKIDEDTLRRLLLRTETLGAWDMMPPAPAGYVQLPRNIVFARIDEGAHAESLDGFFFIMPGINDPAIPPYAGLDALLVLGMTPNRGGFSVISVSTDMPADTPGHLGDVVARETGQDFENVLPGGEGKLFAVTNSLEGLKLVARCFWFLTGHSGESGG